MTQDTVRFALFSEVFAALAHPKRLEIIHILESGEYTAGTLVERTGLSKANVSQHVGILKARGLVYCEKRGTYCYYRLTSPEVLRACESVRQLILGQMAGVTEAHRQLAHVTPLVRRGRDGKR